MRYTGKSKKRHAAAIPLNGVSRNRHASILD